MKVPWEQTVLKRCIRIDILWNRNDAFLGFSVAAVNRSPNKKFQSLKVNLTKGIYDQWDKNMGLRDSRVFVVLS